MPMSEPENVNISPNAINSEWWISPTGGVTNPATNSKTPNPHRLIDKINWTFFISFTFISSRGPHEVRDFVGRAEALGAFNSPSEFCAPQLPNARTKMHNAKAVVNCKRFMLIGPQSPHASSAKCTDTGFCTWFDCGSSLDLVPW